MAGARIEPDQNSERPVTQRIAHYVLLGVISSSGNADVEDNQSAMLSTSYDQPFTTHRCDRVDNGLATWNRLLRYHRIQEPQVMQSDDAIVAAGEEELAWVVGGGEGFREWFDGACRRFFEVCSDSKRSTRVHGPAGFVRCFLVENQRADIVNIDLVGRRTRLNF